MFVFEGLNNGAFLNMNSSLSWLGTLLARYLAQEVRTQGTVPPTPAAQMLSALRPGDVLLVEGHSRVSTAIKYLTQSTWSHAALYVGPFLADSGGNPEHCFVEADTVEGVRSAGMGTFESFHSRICRPMGLTPKECQKVADFAIARIGDRYDLRNVFDLARYLLPTPPVPSRFRRRMLSIGSGDPTRAICSTLIAQAFQSIQYPILPVSSTEPGRMDCPEAIDEGSSMRHHSLFAPRDFDVSPYFQIIKPNLTAEFDFHALNWRQPVVRNAPPALDLAFKQE